MRLTIRRNPPSARLFLHAGLHKTGTTAIQAAFAAAAPAGLLYPLAGRPTGLDGHHNIAWQLAADPRFDPACGTIDDLAAELAATDTDALISSEDFEGVLAKPERLLPLRRGREVTVLIYLRDQVSYAESLFSELQHHGLACTATAFCDEILATGQLRFGAWRFVFDYAALRRRLGQARLSHRMRLHDPGGGASVVADLCAVLGRPAIEEGPRLNRRDTLLRDVARFRANRTGGDPDELHARLAVDGGVAFGNRRALLSVRRREAFRRRFSLGNARLARRCGFAAEALAPRALPDGSLDMEAVFADDE